MGLGALIKIQKLLTKRNVELLLTVFAILSEPRHPMFQPFWKAFSTTRGGSVDDVSAGAGLVERLRDILREYLGEI